MIFTVLIQMMTCQGSIQLVQSEEPGGLSGEGVLSARPIYADLPQGGNMKHPTAVLKLDFAMFWDFLCAKGLEEFVKPTAQDREYDRVGQGVGGHPINPGNIDAKAFASQVEKASAHHFFM